MTALHAQSFENLKSMEAQKRVTYLPAVFNTQLDWKAGFVYKILRT